MEFKGKFNIGRHIIDENGYLCKLEDDSEDKKRYTDFEAAYLVMLNRMRVA